MSVRPSVRPSVQSTKSFSDSDEIWCVGRGRWVMYDGMPYDPIQGQGHETFKVRNSTFFKIYLLRHFLCELENDHWFWNYGTISKFCMDRFLISVRVFVSRYYEPQSRMRLFFDYNSSVSWSIFFILLYQWKQEWLNKYSCLWNDILCVEWDVKPCSLFATLQSTPTMYLFKGLMTS